MTAASYTSTASSVSNVSISKACCSGFAWQRETPGYAFVTDLEWADGRRQSVKRNFADFQCLHAGLLKLFPELKYGSKYKLRLKTSILDYFIKDEQYLTEKREPLIDAYLRNLFKQPERVRRCSQVINFFEPRVTDPKPSKIPSPVFNNLPKMRINSSENFLSKPVWLNKSDFLIKPKQSRIANNDDYDYQGKEIEIAESDADILSESDDEEFDPDLDTGYSDRKLMQMTMDFRKRHSKLKNKFSETSHNSVEFSCDEFESSETESQQRSPRHQDSPLQNYCVNDI